MDIDNMTLVEYVNQREYWYATDDGLIEITKMTDGHRALAARWLMTHATPIISVIESAYHESIAAQEGKFTLSDILGLMAQNPRQWMQNTLLYRALVKGLPEVP